MASAEFSARDRAASIAGGFVEGIKGREGFYAEQATLRTTRPQPVGPEIRIGDSSVAQVIYFLGRVQARVGGNPVFAEKVEPTVGIQVTRTEQSAGREVIETDRYPYQPGLRNVPEEVLLSLAEGITQRR